MQILKSIQEVRQWRRQSGRVAFVPTMGNLHEGHLALVRAAQATADHVIVSIFVNRLQFGQGEDFDSYPRTFAQDCEKLEQAGVAALFLPDEKELYPHTIQRYNVEPPALQNELCGAFRPGHFRGVATVVAKLFNIVTPDVACFGKKDYQQLAIIQAMVQDLNFGIEILPVDTGRADDGLALSSRNGYLSPEERRRAPQLYQALQTIAQALRTGATRYAELERNAHDQLSAAGWAVDYVAIRQAQTLLVPPAGDSELVVLGAARLGKTRLIDNIEVSLRP